MPFTSNYLTCAEREIHLTEWGVQHKDVVIAWHGLARTGRDMNEVAQHLSTRYRVICPDTIGRGLSQWSVVYKPYVWLSDAQWQRLTETSTRRLPDGRVTPHHDPAMVQQFISHPNDYLIWYRYDQINIPVLCLRGAESDLVLPETLDEMLHRGPGALGLTTVIEIEGCGHRPALNVPQQLNKVSEFIDALTA